MQSLSPRRRSELRARAHKLSPVVIIGDKGLTDEVLAEIDRSLTAHELIKIRAAAGEREARAAWMEAICEKLDAKEVQSIGKILVVFRENPKEPRPTLSPGPSPKAGGKSLRSTARPRSRTSSRPPASEPRRRRPRTSR